MDSRRKSVKRVPNKGRESVKRRPGEIIERKEEVLEVGLERYAKPTSRVPSWLVNYGVWIFVAIVGLIVVLPFSVFGSRSIFGGSAPTPQGPPAQLSIISGPSKIWMEGSRSKLKSVQVKVGNRSSGDAADVEIIASVRGELFRLEGPISLPSGKVAQYAGPVEVSIGENDSVNLFLRCANCAR